MRKMRTKKNENDLPEVPEWGNEETLEELTNGRGEDDDDE